MWIPGLRNHSLATVSYFLWVHTYTYCCLMHWQIFFRFSAIKIPKQGFSSDLPIGASPRRHKELLVHEEEDSRHLDEPIKSQGMSRQNPATNLPTYEHSWEPFPPPKKRNQSRWVYCNTGESSRFPRFSIEAINYMELWLVEARRVTRYTDITFWRHGVLNQISFWAPYSFNPRTLFF